MKKLIILGLGNPGSSYDNTLHNAGKDLVQVLVDSTRPASIDHGLYIYSLYDHPNRYFASTHRYMNESGLDIGEYLSYYKLVPKNCFLIILQDDSDLELGRLKLAFGGGHAGHRGVSSVYAHLPSTWDIANVCRLKIGIRAIGEGRKSIDFVLSHSSTEFREWLTVIAPLCHKALDYIEIGQFAKAIELVNSYSPNSFNKAIKSSDDSKSPNIAQKQI